MRRHDAARRQGPKAVTSIPAVAPVPVVRKRVSLPLIDYIDMVSTELVKDGPLTLDTPVEGVFMTVLQAGDHGGFSETSGFFSGEDPKDLAITVFGRVLRILVKAGATKEQLTTRLLREVDEAVSRRGS